MSPGNFLHPVTLANRWRFVLAVAGAFLARLAYGLSSPFWYEDERQVYLIGLRSFARSEWPYFGTEIAVDVVGAGRQLPGALQGWLIRLPLEIWAIPESPFVFLNLLSFGMLALLAWYCRRRLPGIRPWLVWAAVLTLPWTLNFSTHVVNTSYILPAAILFFVGFLEGTPTFRAGLLPLPLAWSMMGAGVFAVMQVHMSWVVLPPYIAFAAIDLLRKDRRQLVRGAAGLATGSMAIGILLWPTLAREGLGDDGASVVGFYPAHATEVVTILARFLSFASFETNRFLGLTTAERILFLGRQPWLLPFVLFVTVIGFVQPVLMAVGWFRRGHADGQWDNVRRLAASSVLWIAVAFMFSARRPYAHAFYVMFPVAFVYAAWWWARSASPHWYRVAAASFVAGGLMHAGLAIDRAGRLSLYADRPLVQAALTERNDRFLGDRRTAPGRQDPPRPLDPVDPEAWLQANPARELTVVEMSWSTLPVADVSRFAVAVQNTSAAAAYLDLQYATRYFDAAGMPIAERQGVIKAIVQPGETRRWDSVADGSAPDGAVAADLRILTAEKVIPAPSARNRSSS